ncbi:hypothetical protein HDU83_002571 [Entophlyctis luteolus]|nr:hypothetical protein HDU83_002571 [Entophlyctis luteolus]
MASSSAAVSAVVDENYAVERELFAVRDAAARVARARGLLDTGETEKVADLRKKWLDACRRSLVELRDLLRSRSDTSFGIEPKNFVYQRPVTSLPTEESDTESYSSDEEPEAAGWMDFIRDYVRDNDTWLVGDKHQLPKDFDNQLINPPIHENNDCDGDDSDTEKHEECKHSGQHRWNLRQLATALGMDVEAMGQFDEEGDCFLEE